MIHLRPYIVAFFIVSVATACNNNPDQKAVKSDTSTTVAADTAAKAPENIVYEDCYEKFFHDLPRLNDSDRVMLTLKNGSKVKFNDFAKEEGGKYARYGIKSIDNDTIPELIMYNYTGGAHCCDEIFIFSKSRDGYVYRSKLYGGFVCIDPATNVFTYSLNETLGYFFACYACGFSDSAKGFKTIREIELQYKNGRLELKPYDSATEKQLIANLEILKEHGYENLEGLMDNGWRKEFAMNFAVWHYNHGKKWNETKKLYDKYYTFKDAAAVWKELYTSLSDAGKESSL